MSHSTPSPLDAALDLLVYVPVGLALTVGEEVPRLAAKGRARLGNQIMAARMVGQFAVAQGRRQVDRRVNAAAPGTRATGRSATPTAAPPTSPEPERPSREPAQAAGGARSDGVRTPSRSERDRAGSSGRAAASTSSGSGSSRAQSSRTRGGRPGGGRPGGGATGTAHRPASAAARATPAVGTLAIPQYDSLSASQVVSRLAGLAPDELEAVVRYEAATRGRRTILARAGQLRGT